MEYSEIEKKACEDLSIDVDSYQYMKSEKEKNATRFGTVAEILYSETTGYIKGYTKCLTDRPTVEEIEDAFKGLRDCIQDSDIAEFYIHLAKTIFTDTE